MFPDISSSTLGNYCTLPMNDAVNAILKLPQNITSIEEFFDHLKSQLEGHVYLDVENLVGDAFHFFKSGTFDSSKKLRVRFTNQPGIDDGGLTRQFFNKLFLKLSDPEDNDRLFEGNVKSFLPVNRIDTALSKMFQFIGKIFSYAVTHGFRPLPLSEAALTYILYNDLDMALEYVKWEDVGTPASKHFVEEVIIN